MCAHERPFDKTKHKTFAQMNNICKAQRIKERQLRSKKTRQHMMPVLVWYKFDPDDSRQIILSNGTRIRQAIDGVGLYCTEGGRFYSLTRYGLRPIRVQLAPKKNYGKRIIGGRGHHQGQHYPHVAYGRGKRYTPCVELMAPTCSKPSITHSV